MAKSEVSRDTLALASTRVESSPIELLRSILGLQGGGDPRTLLATDPRFQDLIEIVNLAIQIHGDNAAQWFVQPEPELGSVLPATLMRDPANGRYLVKQSLMNHLRGKYALSADSRVLPKSLPLPPSAATARLAQKTKGRRPKKSR